MKKTRNYILLILVVMLTLTACGPSYEARIEEAESLTKDGDLAGAEEVYLELIEEEPEEIEAYMGLGELYMSMSELEKAEEYFLRAPEMNVRIVSNLFELARYSDGPEDVDRIYEEYKEHERIGEEPRFFEAVLKSYTQFMEEDRLEEVIHRVAELELKLDTELIVDTYNELRYYQNDELAREILDLEIYDKEQADLSLIVEMTEDSGDRRFLNLATGYFTNSDKLDIALLYEMDSEEYYKEREILLLDGQTAELIASYRSETVSEYMKIGAFDKTGDRDDVIYIHSHAGGSGTPYAVTFYGLVNGELDLIDYEGDIYGELDINFMDGYEYEIRAEELGISYLQRLSILDIPYYRENNLYNEDGKYIGKEGELGIGYTHTHVQKTEEGPDRLYTWLRLLDSMENNSEIALIKTYYEIEDNRFTMVDMWVGDSWDTEIPKDYREAEDYVETDFTDLAIKEDELKGHLSLYIDLFNETANSVVEKYGQPISTGGYGGATYYEYEDFFIFYPLYDLDEPITAVWTRDLVGLENNKEKIFERFGLATESYYNPEFMESNTVYKMDGQHVWFVNLGDENPYIQILKKESKDSF